MNLSALKYQVRYLGKSSTACPDTHHLNDSHLKSNNMMKVSSVKTTAVNENTSEDNQLYLNIKLQNHLVECEIHKYFISKMSMNHLRLPCSFVSTLLILRSRSLFFHQVFHFLLKICTTYIYRHQQHTQHNLGINQQVSLSVL